MLAPLKIVVHLHGDLKQDSQEALSLQCYYNGGENTFRRSSFPPLSLSFFPFSFLPFFFFFIHNSSCQSGIPLFATRISSSSLSFGIRFIFRTVFRKLIYPFPQTNCSFREQDEEEALDDGSLNHEQWDRSWKFNCFVRSACLLLLLLVVS